MVLISITEVRSKFSVYRLSDHLLDIDDNYIHNDVHIYDDDTRDDVDIDDFIRF